MAGRWRAGSMPRIRIAISAFDRAPDLLSAAEMQERPSDRRGPQTIPASSRAARSDVLRPDDRQALHLAPTRARRRSAMRTRGARQFEVEGIGQQSAVPSAVMDHPRFVEGDDHRLSSPRNIPAGFRGVMRPSRCCAGTSRRRRRRCIGRDPADAIRADGQPRAQGRGRLAVAFAGRGAAADDRADRAERRWSSPMGADARRLGLESRKPAGARGWRSMASCWCSRSRSPAAIGCRAAPI